MEALRTQAPGPLNTLPANDALRASFDRLHRLSVNLEVSVLLAGLLALFLTSRAPAPTIATAPSGSTATQPAGPAAGQPAH
jgi:hypothetical protein